MLFAPEIVHAYPNLDNGSFFSWTDSLPDSWTWTSGRAGSLSANGIIEQVADCVVDPCVDIDLPTVGAAQFLWTSLSQRLPDFSYYDSLEFWAKTSEENDVEICISFTSEQNIVDTWTNGIGYYWNYTTHGWSALTGSPNIYLAQGFDCSLEFNDFPGWSLFDSEFVWTDFPIPSNPYGQTYLNIHVVADSNTASNGNIMSIDEVVLEYRGGVQPGISALSYYYSNAIIYSLGAFLFLAFFKVIYDVIKEVMRHKNNDTFI